MNSHFLSNLCSYCTEDTAPLQDKALHEHFSKLEQEFIACMGYEFVVQYQQAANRLHAYEFDTAILRGLQFAPQFMLAVLPTQQSSTSSP